MDASRADHLLAEALDLAVVSSVFFQDRPPMHFRAQKIEMRSTPTSSNGEVFRQAGGDGFLKFGPVGVRNGKSSVATQNSIVGVLPCILADVLVRVGLVNLVFLEGPF